MPSDVRRSSLILASRLQLTNTESHKSSLGEKVGLAVDVPGLKSCSDPLTKEQYRHRLQESIMPKAIKDARNSVEIPKPDALFGGRMSNS